MFGNTVAASIAGQKVVGYSSMYMVRKKISASGNQERELPSSMTAGQRIQRYQYDHTGARVKKVVDGVTTEYRIAGDLLVSEITNGQTFWYHYDSGANLVSIVIGGKNYFYVRNLQNDVIALVDEDGNEVVHYTYDSWGKILSITGSLKAPSASRTPSVTEATSTTVRQGCIT